MPLSSRRLALDKATQKSYCCQVNVALAKAHLYDYYANQWTTIFWSGQTLATTTTPQAHTRTP